MFSSIYTASLIGLNANSINVETHIEQGIPNVNIVGLANTSIKESKDRVRSAIKNSKLNFPMRRITINLSPASEKKSGSHFDLPIAISILLASKQIKPINLKGVFFLGELSLNGNLQSVNGVLAMIIHMKSKGFNTVFIPHKNLKEAKIIKDINIIAVKNLNEVVKIMNDFNNININSFFNSKPKIKASYMKEDFLDIEGQDFLKRAFEIAASGNHNLLLVGPPGSSKTMASKRLAGILPELSYDEVIETTMIYSVIGALPKEGIITKRPFRSPHHSATTSSLTGGGHIPKPGEFSLSHNGVLFLDEIGEFNKKSLELLRQPLEDKSIILSRAEASCKYPCDFLLIGAMNPCPCGYFKSKKRECKCSASEVQKYLNKISGPLLDRIDLIVEVEEVSLNFNNHKNNHYSTTNMRKRVINSIKIQEQRYNKKIYNSNLSPNDILRYCKLNKSSESIIKQAFDKLNLTMRSYHKVLKVSRTIADLDKEENINTNHILEALQYRSSEIFN